MADQRIDQLNAETTPAAVDVLPVYSIAGADTKKITVKNLIQVGATLIDNGSIPASKVNLGALNIVDASIDANAEISVSKLADGSARQLLQTDAAGTGVEWASNIDIPGTLDVTSAATFDSTVAVVGALTKSGSNVVTVGDSGTVTSAMLLDGTILDGDISASAEIAVSKLADGLARQLLQTDAAGTGVEWASDIDIPGTLDVTSAATFDSTVAVTGALTKSGSNVVTVGDSGTVTSAMLLNGTIVDADINANAEIAVSKLVDGTARQLLQTDAAGTDVEWASNIDIPGTLDVTNAATFDSTVAVAGALTKGGSNVVTVGDTGTVTSIMLLDGTIVDADINASAAIAYSKLATLTSGNIVLGNSANVATSTAVTGDVTIGDTGVTAISSGVIVDADINASAAIAYSKLAALTSGNIVLGSSASVATSTPITGDVTISNTGVTAIAAGVIADADINASAAIVDTKLATIATAGKVSNSATTATDANTPSAIVVRDASGNFTAGTITASLTGTASGNLVSGGALGTPSSGTLTSCTGLPVSTGISGLGTGAATFLATPSSANLAALLTDETGTGAAVFATSPTLVSPALGTPSSGVLTNCTGLPIATVSVAGAMLPGTGLSITGGGVVNHTNSATAGTTSGITFDAQGHITTTAALVGGDLPVATSGVIGAVRPGTGLTVDGSGILDISAATNIALGGVIAGSDFGISTGTISLATQGGLTAGTYTKATFNSKGIATGGTALVAGDIPNLAASQITSGSLDIARIATNTVTSAKLANYAVTKIGDTQPTADHIGEFFFNPLSRDLFLWDGNVYQPIGISVGEIVFAGTFDASLGSGTGLISSVTTEGTAIGLAIGQALPAAAAGNSRYYLVVAESGTITTGNAPHVVLAPPDILLSNGITWTEIDVSQTITAQSANNIGFTPAGSIISTNVQTAIQELDGDKLAVAGGTVTGNLEIGAAGSLSFEGATANAFETTIALVDPTADRTISLPDISGTVITTGDTGTVTSAMISDGTIVDADISATAEIAVSKLVDGAARQLLQTDAAGTGVEWASNIDIPGTLDVTSAATFDSTVAVTGALTKSGSNVVTVGDTGTVTSTMLLNGTILDADINASAAIVDTKLATIATAGKVSNSATTAASANTPSAIVVRDASGDFTAGTITAALTGNASTVTTNANLTGHITSVGNAAVLGSFTSAQLAAALTDETGSGGNVFATSPTLVTPALGTPASGTLTSCTGLPISTGVSGLGTGAATFLATPSSANLAALLTDETGSGSNVFATSPTLVTPVIGAATGTSLSITGAAGLLTRAAATQDGVELIGRAGGTTSLKATITPTTLTASRTFTLPDATGTLVTTGDTGTVTSTMLLNGTILDGDINASAAIAGSKIVAATTSVVGAVQLSDSTSTTSSVLAATPTAVKAAYDQANTKASLSTAQTFTAAQRGTISALTDGATITADFAVANNFSVTLGGNRTLANPSNQTAGQSGCIWITQDGTGSRTLAYGSQWDFTGGTAPTLSTTAAAVDCLVYAVQSSTKITATLITNLS